jgi:hypothetical protein
MVAQYVSKLGIKGLHCCAAVTPVMFVVNPCRKTMTNRQTNRHEQALKEFFAHARA